VAACGAPIVGWLAERLGFDSSGDGEPSDMQRAKALGDAIVICTAGPWALCCLLYSGVCVDGSACLAAASMAVHGVTAFNACTLPAVAGLHVTYPRDRRLALRSQRTRSGYATSLPALAAAPSPDLWELTPGGSPTAVQTSTGQGASFVDGRPSL
jgi:hypothetical protein